MNEREHLAPTDRQARYLRYLISQAHLAGVPYLPIEHLHRDGVAAWIEYLDLLVQAHGNIQRDLARLREETAQKEAPAPYLATPPRARAPDGYRPPYEEVPAALDHEHRLDCYLTEDDHEIVYCTMCGGEW
jgi:hypothetical protein